MYLCDCVVSVVRTRWVMGVCTCVICVVCHQDQVGDGSVYLCDFTSPQRFERTVFYCALYKIYYYYYYYYCGVWMMVVCDLCCVDDGSVYLCDCVVSFVRTRCMRGVCTCVTVVCG